MQLINATMGCGRVGVVGTKGWAFAIAEPQTDSHWWLWFGTEKRVSPNGGAGTRV